MSPKTENINEIWNELIENERKKNTLLPGEKTRRMIMEEYNMTVHDVDVFLRRLREAGKLSIRDAVVNGKKCVVYFITGQS